MEGKYYSLNYEIPVDEELEVLVTVDDKPEVHETRAVYEDGSVLVADSAFCVDSDCIDVDDDGIAFIMPGWYFTGPYFSMRNTSVLLWKRTKDGEEMEKETKRTETVPIYQKLLLTIPETAEYSHIGINRIEKMAKEPTCKFVLYVGNKKLIKRKAFEKYIESALEI